MYHPSELIQIWFENLSHLKVSTVMVFPVFLTRRIKYIKLFITLCFLLYDMIRYHIMYHIWFNMIWYNIIMFYMRSCSIIKHNIICYNVVMYHLILCIIWYCIMLCYVLCNQIIYNTVQYRIKFFNTVSYLKTMFYATISYCFMK